MAYNVKTHPAFAGYDLPQTNTGFGGVRGLFRTLALWSAEKRAYNDTVAELDALSDRDLADIGVARCDIPAIAREAAANARRSR
jgi:uncharacterized protein YjiS (DUF1127 family)